MAASILAAIPALLALVNEIIKLSKQAKLDNKEIKVKDFLYSLAESLRMARTAKSLEEKFAAVTKFHDTLIKK